MSSSNSQLVRVGSAALAGSATCLTGAIRSGEVMAGDDRGEVAIWNPDRGLERHYRMPSAVASVAISADGSLRAALDVKGRLRVTDRDGRVCFDALTGDARMVRTSAKGDCFHVIDHSNGHVEILNFTGQVIQRFEVPCDVAGYEIDNTDGACLLVTRAGLVVRFTPWGRQVWAKDFSQPAAGLSLDAAASLLTVALHQRGAECLLPDDGVAFGHFGGGRNVRAVALCDAAALLSTARAGLFLVDRCGKPLGDCAMDAPADDVFLESGGLRGAYRSATGEITFLELREVETLDPEPSLSDDSVDLEDVIVDKQAGPSRPRVRVRSLTGVPSVEIGAQTPETANLGIYTAPASDAPRLHTAGAGEPEICFRSMISVDPRSGAQGGLWIAPDGSSVGTFSESKFQLFGPEGSRLESRKLREPPLAVALAKGRRGLLVTPSRVESLFGHEHPLAQRFILTATQAQLPPDGAALSVLDEFGGVRLFERSTGEELRYELPEVDAPPRYIAAFGFGVTAAIGPGRFHVISPNSAQVTELPLGPGTPLNLVTAIAPGAVLTQGADVQILGWSGSVLWRNTHSATITRVLSGPAGQLLLTGDQGVAVLDPSGRPRGKHARVQGRVMDIVGSAQDPLLVIVDGHRVVVVSAHGRPLWQITFEQTVHAVRALPDASVLVALVGQDLVRVHADPRASSSTSATEQQRHRVDAITASAIAPIPRPDQPPPHPTG